MYDFENFPVFIKSEQFYKDINIINKNYKIPIHLKDQLDRAASSIVLNIAEGAGKYGKKDKKKFYVIARGSAQECVAIIKLLKIREYISEKDYLIYYEALTEISKMLSGLIRTMLEL